MSYNNLLEKQLSLIKNNSETTSGNIIDRVETIQLSLFSPEEVLANSYGEVVSAETLNYRTHRPVAGGLHCEAIFGPYSNWECPCGKYKGRIYKGIKCSNCGVVIDSSNVRRTRMGHIKLNVPVVHTWFYTATSNNVICHLLDIGQRDLVEFVHYRKYLLLDADFENNFVCSIIREEEYQALDEERKKYAGKGGEMLLKAFQMMNLSKLLALLVAERENEHTFKRINTVNMFLQSGVKPEHMLITVLPVLPADLRPIVSLESGILGTTDTNYFYRSIILRNRRCVTLAMVGVPDIILEHGYSYVQKAVDALIDNSKLKQPLKNKTRILKSLTDELSGKRGILRMNLLGKRVDFSARSVIVVDSSLKLNQCGIPKDMALELFKPFIIQRLLQDKLAVNVDGARRLIIERTEEVWSILRDVSRTRNVIINRAPTLHKHGIQSFDIVLVEGYAIRIHPLVCTGFNADFDGDQMAVYLSMTPQTVVETRLLMYAPYNTFSNASGRPIISPVREILMGCYFISMIKRNAAKHTFSCIKNALACYKMGKIDIHEEVSLYINKQFVNTNVGRIIINEVLPLEFRNYEIIFGKKAFDKLIYQVQEKYGFDRLSQILDDIKELGFHHSSQGAISMSLKDMCIPVKKQHYVEKAQNEINELQYLLDHELISLQEFRTKSIYAWTIAVNDISADLSKEYEEFNDINITMKSGARGGIVQSRQLSGIKGLISDAEGNVLQIPIISSFKEGLSSFEYFVSSYGARKGIIDKSIKTANSGYLTRRLVDVSHDVVVQEEDCGSTDFICYKSVLNDHNEVVLSNSNRVIGRTLAVDTVCNDNTVLRRNHVLSESDVKKIEGDIKIRGVFTCKTRGVCSACYGFDLSSRKMVDVGSAVGIIAAQSIGEPATQLTMRTFHTGGVLQRETAMTDVYATTAGLVKVNAAAIKAFGGYNLYKYIFIQDSTMSVGNQTYNVKSGDILCVEPNSTVNIGDRIVFHEVLIDIFFAPISGTLSIKNEIYEKNVLGSIKVFSKKASEYFVVTITNNEKSESIYINSGSIRVYKNIEVKQGDTLFKNIRELGIGDIVDDLSRVQNLLEARKPTYRAIYSPCDGIVSINEKADKSTVTITDNEGKTKDFSISNAEDIIVTNNSSVYIGQQITKGDVDAAYILEYFDLNDAKIFLLNKIKSVYLNSSVDINDKHLEVIVEKMFFFVRVTKNVDEFFVGETYPRFLVEEASEKRLLNGKEAIPYKTVAMGITKAAMSSEGFISAASFQSTKKVLARNALRGSIDYLKGLKENIIVGNPIPAGTGKNYDNVSNAEKATNIFYLCQRAFKTLEVMLESRPRLTEEAGWLEEVIAVSKRQVEKEVSSVVTTTKSSEKSKTSKQRKEENEKSIA